MTPQAYLAVAIAAASFAAGGGLAWKYQGARLETCQAKSANLSESLSEQNRRVEALAQAGDKARREAQEAAKQAAEAEVKATVADKKRRDAIKAGAGPATCAAAISIIRRELRP